MPTKKTKRKVVKKVDNEGGTVSVHVGLKLVANYQSEDFNVGATLPIQENETVMEAFDRTEKLVSGFFEETHNRVFDDLTNIIGDRKKGRSKKR